MIVATHRSDDAAGVMGNRDYQVYLARVGADWQLLSEAVERASKTGKISGELWQAFAGDYGAWTQFYSANKDPIMPLVGASDLDQWAERAKTWDGALRAQAGGGVAGPGVIGAQQSTIAQMVDGVSNVAHSAFWLMAAGAGVWLLLKFTKGEKK
jgi:hypothetical protein